MPSELPSRSSTDFSDTLDVLARAGLVKLEIDRLGAEARSCNDADRMTAIRQEMEVLHNSMLDIRREQLMAQLKPAKKKRWWQRG